MIVTSQLMIYLKRAEGRNPQIPVPYVPHTPQVWVVCTVHVKSNQPLMANTGRITPTGVLMFCSVTESLRHHIDFLILPIKPASW